MAAVVRAAPDLRHVSFVGAADPVLPRLSRRSLCLASLSRPAHRISSAVHEGIELDPLIVWLLRRAGLDPRAYRAKPLQRRLPVCLRAVGAASPAEATLKLARRPELIRRALSILLLGVSEFFRDRQVFASLQSDVLPELAKRGQPLRIWSAGCSDGQELYSLAMLLDEIGLLEGSVLLGTDCRADAVACAATGAFSASAMDAVDPQLRRRYFRQSGDTCRVGSRIRAGIRWQVSNLLSDAAEPGWDLILWRNVAIYLTQDAGAAVWRKLTDALRPGGVLVSGRAERPTNTEDFCRLSGCIYRRI